MATFLPHLRLIRPEGRPQTHLHAIHRVLPVAPTIHPTPAPGSLSKLIPGRVGLQMHRASIMAGAMAAINRALILPPPPAAPTGPPVGSLALLGVGL